MKEINIKETIIGVDCDDVVINLVPNWLYFYNEHYKDNLKVDDIQDWDISRYVKPECGKKIYEYIHPDTSKSFLKRFNIYDFCDPVKNSLMSIQELRNMGYRVIFVTASNRLDAKYNWLEHHGFLDNRANFVHAFDKNLINMDYLIDDRWENITSFANRKNNNKKGILFNQPWNLKYNDNYNNYDYIRVNNWTDVVKYFKNIEGNQ